MCRPDHQISSQRRGPSYYRDLCNLPANTAIHYEGELARTVSEYRSQNVYAFVLVTGSTQTERYGLYGFARAKNEDVGKQMYQAWYRYTSLPTLRLDREHPEP
jgi:hypothetical protein